MEFISTDWQRFSSSKHEFWNEEQVVFVLFWWCYLRSWWNKPHLLNFFLMKSFLRSSLGICSHFLPFGLAVYSRVNRAGNIVELVSVCLVLPSQQLWGHDQILYQVIRQENVPNELWILGHRKGFLFPQQLQMSKTFHFLLSLMKLEIKKNRLSYHPCSGLKFSI